jgi:hypothetical protein
MATSNSHSAPPAWLETAARTEPLGSPERIALAPSAVTAVPLNDAPPASSSEESDVGLYGFAMSALAPSTALLFAGSVGLIAVAIRFSLSGAAMQIVLGALVAAWLCQIVRGGYRLMAYRYRLTTERLFRFRGPLYPRDEPLKLAEIGRVEMRQTLLQKMLRVGDIVVVPEESSMRPPLELAGIRGPKQVIATIEKELMAAREAAVTQGMLRQRPPRS